MNKTNLDQALAALSDALKSTDPNSFLENPKDFVKKIPFRSLSGDHINGGKVMNFSSSGIADRSTSEQISITDNGLVVSKFSKGFEVSGDIQTTSLSANTIYVDRIEAKEILGKVIGEVDNEPPLNVPLRFESDNIEGLGLLWAGKDYTKQFVFLGNPDRIFLSESIDLARNKNFNINNLMVLNENSLGTTVTKSYLREVGRLRGLIVEGSTSLGEYFYFDSTSKRLGIGTEQPNAAISIVENDVELVIGTNSAAKAIVGTLASHSLDIVTDNQSRINISSDGNVLLGNFKTAPIQTSINGKLSVRVQNPDPDVDLHVAGSVKFNGKLQTHGTASPDSGSFNKGDIVWNTDPRIGSYVGWICVQSGTPGLWEPFGKIGNQ